MSARSLPVSRAESAVDPRLQRFVDQWAVLLTTCRRDGSAVGTVVNIAVEGDRAFFRTYDRSGKARRLRHHPRVQIAPSTWRGRITGEPMSATARLLSGAEAAHAAELIDRKHPIFQRLFVRLGHRVQRYRTSHYEVRPDGRQVPPPRADVPAEAAPGHAFTTRIRRPARLKFPSLPSMARHGDEAIG